MQKLQSRILLAIFVVLIFGLFAASWAIGKKKAAGIIDFRETNGPFKRPEDLIKVPGIGPKTFEANKHLITVK